VPLNRTYSGQACSIASALEIVGERWTMLIIREALLGVHRFDELQADLGVARNVLQMRLEHLVGYGILERRLYQERPQRYAYHLTEKGLDLWPAVVALMHWGDKHAVAPGGPPVALAHRDCGGAVDDHLMCAACGARLGPREVWAYPADHVPADHPLRRRVIART
jgi:DNA-binding HxlR family transcriptional regulator